MDADTCRAQHLIQGGGAGTGFLAGGEARNDDIIDLDHVEAMFARNGEGALGCVGFHRDFRRKSGLQVRQCAFDHTGRDRLMPIRVTLDQMLTRRGMKARELAAEVGISETQLSLFRSGKVKGIRFRTLAKLCAVLECTPGDLLDYDYLAEDLRGPDSDIA